MKVWLKGFVPVSLDTTEVVSLWNSIQGVHNVHLGGGERHYEVQYMGSIEGAMRIVGTLLKYQDVRVEISTQD